MKTQKIIQKIITVRCKAFSGESVRQNRCMVETSGVVRVWDSVAGHYTTCHSLREKTQARIRKLANIPCVESHDEATAYVRGCN